MPTNTCPSAEYLTEAELAERWKLSRRSLQRWRADGKLRFHHKFGGSIRYALADVERMEAAARIKAQS